MLKPGSEGQDKDSSGGSVDISVRIATFSSIQQKLRNRIVSNFWYDSSINPSRVYRPPSDEKYGPGARFNMSLAAAWMSSGPDASKEDANIVAIRAGADDTFKDYMRSLGVLGEHRDIEFHDFPVLAASENKKIYNVDDLPSEWDQWTANSAHMHKLVNNKKNLNAVSSFPAPYEIVNLRTTVAEDFERVGKGQTVYVKTNNTENTGDGVFRCQSAEEYVRLVAELRINAERHGLDMEIVLQPIVEGDNHSFQLFMDPSEPQTVDVMTVSTQLVEDDGKTYLTNKNPPLTLERLDPAVCTLMTDMVKKIRALDPQTFGFLMCDFFRTPDGRLLAFDPGLRPSGNTPTILSRMFLEEQTKQSGYMSEMFGAPARQPGMSFAEYIRPIEHLMGPDAAMRDAHCVLPWGYNHIQGKALLIALAPTSDGLSAIAADVQKRLRS